MKYLMHKGYNIPLIGFGTWNIGDYKNKEKDEINTMVYGIKNHDMTLIDTAEMYGDGRSERLVSSVIKEFDRDKLFIVGKILPTNAKDGLYEESCKRSLENLGIKYFDLYLLHWNIGLDLNDMVKNMEKLKSLGLIKEWGVSNFDVSDMEELFRCKDGDKCFLNQVLYNMCARGIEYDLIPWCKAHNVAVMAYSPLCNSKADRECVTNNKAIKDIALRNDRSECSLMLSFVIRNSDVITVVKTSSITHLDSNIKNVFNPLNDGSLEEINRIYPAPSKKVPLKTI